MFGGWGKLERGLVVAFAEAEEDVVGQFGQILGEFAQRGDLEGEEVKPVEEILAEVALPDEVAEGDEGGGDEADIDLAVAIAAEAADAAVLDGGEDFGLKGEREAGNFVEEEGAAGGGFEEAHALGAGIGKGSLFVAEQFGFGHGFGEGGAIDFDKVGGGAGSVLVEPAGEGGFAGAGFALDEDGREGLGEALVGLQDLVELVLNGFEAAAEEEGSVLA